MIIEDHNKVAIAELGSLTELGGAGSGFDNFDKHVEASGGAILKGNGPGISAPAIEANKDISGLVMANNSKLPSPGGR